MRTTRLCHGAPDRALYVALTSEHLLLISPSSLPRRNVPVKVLVEPGVRVTAIAVDSSLFETLTNVWTFQDVKAPGQCLLTCTIAYKFRSTLYNMQSSMFTNVVASKMVDAFAKRCEGKSVSTNTFL